MYIGWIEPFRRKGPLTQQERSTMLPRQRQTGVEPAQRMALIRLNSTYLDWIDRRYLFRGNFGFLLATLGVLLFVSVLIYVNADSLKPAYTDADGRLVGRWDLGDWAALALLNGFTATLIFFSLKFCLLKEYFTYTYYPIRFNRKTRMVHVFRHNGPGGVLSVPWDKVFFHVGTSGTPDLIDIRGEVLDGDLVKDTFALGHTVSKSSPHALLEMWEFILRYMDEGPEAAGPHPLDRYVGLSVTPSWKNCFLVTRTYYSAGLPWFVQPLVFPLVLLYTVTRWVVLHTCRKPVFPPEIEVTCKVAPDDPNVWPIPTSSGEFAATVPGILERAEERARRQEQMQLQTQALR